jgi:hypothetical protein
MVLLIAQRMALEKAAEDYRTENRFSGLLEPA